MIADADAVLVLGPSTAKHELMTYLEKHDRALAHNVIGVETVDHPTDKQVVALALLFDHRQPLHHSHSR